MSGYLVRLRLDVDPSQGRKNDKYTIARNARRLVLTKAYRAFRDEVALHVRQFCVQRQRIPLEGPLVCTLAIVWRSDSSKRGDVDAAQSAILDGIERGKLIGNDAQVVELHVKIRTCHPAEAPHVWVGFIRPRSA